MLSLGPATRVFLATQPFDMRGSFRSLAGAARRLGLEPTDGHLYVFLSRQRTIAKILCFDRSGWWVFMKRLERGTFQLPDAGGADRLVVDSATLTLLLEGIELRAARRPWYHRGEPSG